MDGGSGGGKRCELVVMAGERRARLLTTDAKPSTTFRSSFHFTQLLSFTPEPSPPPLNLLNLLSWVAYLAQPRSCASIRDQRYVLTRLPGRRARKKFCTRPHVRQPEASRFTKQSPSSNRLSQSCNLHANLPRAPVPDVVLLVDQGLEIQVAPLIAEAVLKVCMRF